MKEESAEETFTSEKKFRATVQPRGNHLILSDGRITGILKGAGTHDQLLREQFPSRIKAGDTILAFYVQGVEHTSAERKTADGQCIFFVYDPGNGHEELVKQTELIVKPETSFFFALLGSTHYCRSTFASFTGIATEDELASTSSTKTGHRVAGLNLLPQS